MKKNKGVRLLVWASLVALFLTALVSYFQDASRFVGKSYVEGDEFRWEMNRFYENLSIAVLNPPDLEAEKKQIIVTNSEIEEHRHRYGTLVEQIDSIEEQYAQRITDAEVGKSENLKTTLMEERDAKIADIRKNFESDAYVEAKIRVSKERQLEQDGQQLIQNAKENLYFPANYELTDVQTGETFTSGDIDGSSSYQKIFDEDEGYFRAEPYGIRDQAFHYSHTGQVSEGGVSARKDEVTQASDRAMEPSQSQTVKLFKGSVIIPDSAWKNSTFGRDEANFNRQKLGMLVLWGLGALALAVVLFVLRFRKEWVTESSFVARYHQVKVDMKVALLLFSIYVVQILLEGVVSRYSWYFLHHSIENGIILGIAFVVLVFFIWATVFQMVLLVERLKVAGMLEQEVKNSYSVKFLQALQEMFLKRKIGVQMFILLIGFFLAGIGFVAVGLSPALIVVYFPLVLFAGLPFLYIFVRRTAYLNRILIATEAMANGRLNEDIKVEGKSPLAEHAKNLNNLREGVRVSMTEQAKSERLKTELITNVSHDLRTPLTSIITYTDLLKNEELSSEERSKYVDILDKKSQRLKTLIEDLFEVSKMASGNLELHKQRVDLVQLLQQALAEHEEEISNSGLDFRVNSPDSPLVAYVDGQRWWRVLDNLIVNAVKYTLPGTRVYITLLKVGDTAEFVVKNVTKYELGENTDELFERFKRADTSRHTDGSGLGLAIAQSIVDMHNGNMKIEVDGDLFKVTVAVAAF